MVSEGSSSVAARRLLIAAASVCRAQARGAQASVVVELAQQFGLRDLEHRLNSCGARA